MKTAWKYFSLDIKTWKNNYSDRYSLGEKFIGKRPAGIINYRNQHYLEHWRFQLYFFFIRGG